MFWIDNMNTYFATLKYQESWTLPPRLSRAMLKSLSHFRAVKLNGSIYLHPYAPPVGGKSFKTYLIGLKKLSRGFRVPLITHLSVTDRCAYKCERCYNRPADHQEPNIESIKILLNKLARSGTSLVALTGGEPVLREDLAEIVKECKTKMTCSLFTSGQAINRQKAKELCDSGLDSVYVSLDHYSASRHDQMRGFAGAYQQAVHAIKAFVDRGTYTAIQTVVEPELLNNGEMGKFIAFCKSLGIHEIMLLEPVNLKNNVNRNYFSDKLRKELKKLHEQSIRDHTIPKISAMSYLESPQIFGCQAGFSFLYISTGGEVFPCDFVRSSYGNIYQEEMETILDRLSKKFVKPVRNCLALKGESDFSGDPIEDESIRLPDLMRWVCEEKDCKVECVK